jgi:hypothetical protein
MPQVTIRTGFETEDGHEEILTEYLCDWPGCQNIATQMLGCGTRTGIPVAICEEHAATRAI